MTDCKYRSRSGYCHRCCSFGTCREEQLTEIRLANGRATTPEAWLEKYNALLKIGGGLTAREWDHYDELKRTALSLQRNSAAAEEVKEPRTAAGSLD